MLPYAAIGLPLILGGLVYWLFMSPYSQVFGDFPWKAKKDEKVIALTFDDGPNEPYTTQIVNFLNERNVKATFFQVGKCIEKYPDTTRKIIQSGHVVGNHSLSHAFHLYLTHPKFETELIKCQEIVKKYTGKTPALFRPPWLWRQPRLLSTLRKHKLQPVSGEFCHSLEVFRIDGFKIARATLKKVKPGAIIIFHDGFDSRGGDRTQTVKAVKIVVDELIARGYKFATIDKLLNLKAYHN